MEPREFNYRCDDPIGIDCDFNAGGSCGFNGYCDHKKLQGNSRKESPSEQLEEIEGKLYEASKKHGW